MQYSILGKSDLNVSRISLGCMSLKEDTQTNSLIINRALEVGINLFDTADLYDKGENEKRVGALLKPHRKDVIIATKVGNQYRADGSGWDWNPGKDYIIGAVENSLKRLQTDYIDLYQLHGGTIEDNMEETIEAFEILKTQGKIRHYGLSSIRPNVITAYVEKSNMVSVMMQYSLLDRRPEEKCLNLLKEHQIGVLTRGSLAQGLLVDKPAKAYLSWSEEQVSDAVNVLKEYTDGSPEGAFLAARYVLDHQAVTSAVVGVSNLSQLEEHIQAALLPTLTMSKRALLARSLPTNFYEEHR